MKETTHSGGGQDKKQKHRGQQKRGINEKCHHLSPWLQLCLKVSLTHGDLGCFWTLQLWAPLSGNGPHLAWRGEPPGVSRVAAGAFALRWGPQRPALVASGKARPHASCSGASRRASRAFNLTGLCCLLFPRGGSLPCWLCSRLPGGGEGLLQQVLPQGAPPLEM